MLSIPTDTVLTVAADSAPQRQLFRPLPEPGHVLLVIDNSALEKWKRCPTAAQYYLVDGREGHARNAALTFGGAVHVGLEAVLRNAPDELIVQSVLRHFTENATPPDDYRTPETAVEVVGHYRQRASLPDYSWELMSDAHGLCLERPFELPLGVIYVDGQIPGHPTIGAVHVAWAGRIDALARVNNAVRVVDHKTTSIDGDNFVQSFQLSSQTLGYLWAAQQLWPGLSPTGFCLNAIRLKKPGKGQGLMERGPRGGEPPLSFFRAFFDYTPERIDQWYHDTLDHISDFIQSLVRGRFPFNDRHCFDKYGQCPYFDVCSIDNVAARRHFLMSAAYKDVTWNPCHDR